MKLSENETGTETTPKAKKPIYKRWWFWAIIVIVVVGAFGSGGKSDTPASSSNAASASTSASASASSAASSAAISAAQSTPESTPVTYTADADSLKQLFTDTLNITQENLDVTYDDTNKCFSVSYHPTDAIWDEADFVRKSISNYISYCQQAYQIDGVTSIDFQVSTNMQDSYGNTNLESVMEIRMVKDNFEKFNWKNLEYQGIYDNFKANCEFFWIAPGILKNVDPSDIYYAP